MKATTQPSDTPKTIDTPAKQAWYQRRWLPFVIGLLLGVVGILAIRFATYDQPHTHYHANFAVFLNGQRFEFKGPQYYEAVSICSSSKGITIPQQRAHMHDNVNNVVHIHDHAVTWGQFFDNLGWTIGPDFIETDDGTMYKAEGENKLHILIDGQDYTDLGSIANTVVKDESKLLVSFGNIDDATLQQENKAVPATAEHYDHSTDPKSCSGAEQLTVTERLHHLF